jgi:cytochrome c-type biogenesis protein CcmE
MNNKQKYILILIIIIALFFSMFTMRNMLTPYVSFTEAKSSNREVQIIGSINKDTVQYKNNILYFILTNNENKIKIQYKAEIPKHFESTKQVVIIGSYNQNKDIFIANKILTKCHSKYQTKK